MSRLVKYTWDRRYGNAAKLYNWTLLCASLNYEEGEYFKLTVSQNMSKYLSTEATKWLHVAEQYFTIPMEGSVNEPPYDAKRRDP